MDLRLDDDLADDDGAPSPWALGHGAPVELFEPTPADDDLTDGWLDDQLRRLQGEQPVAGAGPDPSGETTGLRLRHPAPTRSRRRRADAGAVADLPAPDTPGYRRDRRGTWRYTATGQAVPGARDLTLRSLHRFPLRGGAVLVPVPLVRSEAGLAWCLAWRHTLTTALTGGRSVTVLRVPAAEWERRADVPTGLWAPELTAAQLLGTADVARLAGVSPATITAYLSRRRLPAPVSRIGNSPVWSRPVISHWLSARPGQGKRT